MNKIKQISNYIRNNKDKPINVKELLLNHYEIILMIPLLAFMISPVYHFIGNLLFDSDYPFGGFYTYGYTVDYVIYMSFFFSLAGTILYLINLRKAHNKLRVSDNIPLVFFVIVCLFIIASTCINGFTAAALHGDQYRDESIFSFLSYFLAFYLCGSLINSDRIKKLIIYAFIISNLIIDLACLFNEYIRPIKIWEYSDKDAPSAVFYQFNHYGYFLMLAIIVSAAVFVIEKSIKSRILACFALALNSFILSMNTTFGCFLSCLVGLIFLIIADSILKKRLSFAAMAMFAVFIAVTYVSGLFYHSFFNELKLFFTDIKSVMGTLSEKVIDVTNENKVAVSSADSAGTGRWGLWRNTINYIRERPLFGWGIEGIANRLAGDSANLNTRPHNEYLQYAVFFGIPAAAAYIIGCVSVFIHNWRKRRIITGYTFVCIAASFTYLFSAVFGNTMFYTAPFLFIFLGLSFQRDKNLTQK